jgi:hypothetical protein
VLDVLDQQLDLRLALQERDHVGVLARLHAKLRVVVGIGKDAQRASKT